MVGPWDHEGSGEHTDHAVCVPVPPTAAHRWDAYQAFFDTYVMRAPDAAPVPAVEVFTLNAGWQRPPSWPPPAATADGVPPARRRACSPPSHRPPTSSRTRYDYDPANPIPETLGGNCWELCEALGDRREIEQRPDVLTYATPPLAADLELTGPITAVLYAATSAVDTDFTVAVIDVFEDGTANQIQDGIVRARYRNGMDAPSLVEPGEVVRYEIDLFATSYLLRRGHRLQVDISSSCFDRYDRNPNTGGAYGHAADPVVAHQVDPPRAGACVARRAAGRGTPLLTPRGTTKSALCTLCLGVPLAAGWAGPVRSSCTERGAAFSRRPGYSERPFRGPGAVREAPTKRRPPARCLVVRPTPRRLA